MSGMRTIHIALGAGRMAREAVVSDAATGAPIRGVVSADISLHVSHRARVTLEVLHPELDIAADVERWVGLERVPTEALRDELERRQAQGDKTT